jgi:hypothetical protein
MVSLKLLNFSEIQLLNLKQIQKQRKQRKQRLSYFFGKLNNPVTTDLKRESIQFNEC